MAMLKKPFFLTIPARILQFPGYRPCLSPLALNLLVAGFIMAAHNATFWSLGYRVFDGMLLKQAVFGVAAFALTLLLVAGLGFRWLQRPALAFLLLLSAVTSYYMDTLGVVIDRDMIQNAATTTVTEAKHLVTPNFVLHVAGFGIVPALMVFWVRLSRGGLWRDIGATMLTVGLSAALFLGALMTDLRTYAAVLRKNRELTAAVQPAAPLNGAIQYAAMMLRTRNIEVLPLGRDAQKGANLSAADKPVLAVIVAGETARAQNFGLNGYARDTTPELAARGVINFADVSSCGTATATSLPCMFSKFGRREFSYSKGIGNENLLDVLTHAGFDVEWWENNTGDKAIADRVTARRMTDLTTPEHCARGECIDSVFLDFLRDKAAAVTRDTVIVIHQIGSHGPAYYLRYPPDFARFKPDCQTPELKECSVDEIVNAYDNTIAFTDHFLGEVIDLLDSSDTVLPAMIYASDHGESLGENGLYLHGAPYFMAPQEQTKVPMVMWVPDRFAAAVSLNTDCLRARGAQAASHDNLFHTALGLMDVETEVRQAALDLTAECRHDKLSKVLK